MYDYYLGGSHHLAADREAADALLAAIPDLAEAARANRSFMRRVIGYAATRGVDQFLDLGAGFPLDGGVADVALALNPNSRVVSVDIDPGVVARLQAAISDGGLTCQVGAVHADLRDVHGVVNHPVTRRLVDFDRPVAVLCLSVLHFVGGDLGRVLDPLRTAMTGGGTLALSHASAFDSDDAQRGSAQEKGAIARLIYDCTFTPLTLRTGAELGTLLAGLPLVDPGLVPVEQWRSAAEPAPGPASRLLGGVARIPTA
jgi:cyclopropane fatty-acyl-phospholipid synthase-like methyltransferase